MEPLISHKGLVAALDRVNVDTDQIIPKQFLKRIERPGFGQYLFYDWRFMPGTGELDPNFELNQPRFRGATILLTRDNFGCGSSREHAPWALLEYGFRVILAPSFGDIFYNNCYKNGVLPIMLPPAAIAELFRRVQTPGYSLIVDLKTLRISDDVQLNLSFQVDPYSRLRLLQGVDDIRVTLQYEDNIEDYESQRVQYQLAFDDVIE
ncbi:3-isopropylmalate dehydratase small subunit [Alicyclobacillus tolerans]|uniref:3-isopropylmalate dehydratase small subunit n=1 Tax=Alicyclobacillus tolerans TaxID=90970 RepID=UPI001F016754|nr:3-isopropylmalate dehydratase small subunit [Alicyclobacillus tolerans]MCF8568140.1 3-isopropylmalate dehydratase small subunit [Alicyclobacillus tolerans]